jgi:hypothetical protein
MMVAIAAIALPIVLAVLGVIVSINPPSKKGHDRKIWIGVFILLGIFAVGIGIADRHNSDRAQNELKDSIDQLTKPIPPKAESRHAILIRSIRMETLLERSLGPA